MCYRTPRRMKTDHGRAARATFSGEQIGRLHGTSHNLHSRF
jgi:hypothetical protein